MQLTYGHPFVNQGKLSKQTLQPHGESVTLIIVTCHSALYSLLMTERRMLSPSPSHVVVRTHIWTTVLAVSLRLSDSKLFSGRRGIMGGGVGL